MPVTCNYFVSYAHQDQKEANQLLALLQTQLKIVKNVKFSCWVDKKIVIGNLWKQEITEAMEQSDFGLLLLSPNFFASDYIVEEELSHFLTQDNGDTQVLKSIVPVALKPIILDGSRDIKGVEDVQIFHDQNSRCFNQARGHTKEAFAGQLANQILRKLGIA